MPSGHTSVETTQSPRPARSCRRPPNQPSSRTKRSTPMRAAVSARDLQVVEVGLEVDGLPRVEHDGPRPRRVAGAGAEAAVEAAREAVEPLGRVDEDDRRGGIRLPRGEAHLAGSEQLAAADDGVVAAGTLGQRLDEVLVVAAPRGVHGPDLAGAPVEPGRAGHHAAGSRRGRCGRGGCARRWVPWSRRLRCGERSRHQRPVRSSTSSARTRQRQDRAQRRDVERRACRRPCWSRTRRRGARRARRARAAARGVCRPASSRASRDVVPSASHVTSCHRTAPAAPARCPAQPGVPDQPSASPGSTVSGHGTSSALWRTGAGVTRGEGGIRARPALERGPPVDHLGQPRAAGARLEHERGPGGLDVDGGRVDWSVRSVTSSLGRAERQAGHEVSLEHEEDHEGRDRDDHRSRRPRGCCR